MWALNALRDWLIITILINTVKIMSSVVIERNKPAGLSKKNNVLEKKFD